MNPKKLGKLAKKMQVIFLYLFPSYFLIRVLISIIFDV